MSAEISHAKMRAIKRLPMALVCDLPKTKSVASVEGPAMSGMAMGTIKGSLAEP